MAAEVMMQGTLIPEAIMLETMYGCRHTDAGCTMAYESMGAYGNMGR